MNMKRFFLLIIYLTSFPTVLGALQVNSFSCDSNVAVDGNLNCQAEINDPSSGASITSVNIYLPIDDEWAEQASYVGSGYKSSISQGESTTASFSITPIIAGEHVFDYIKINDITDTNIDYSAVTVNVIAIRSLDINAPSSTDSGTDFTISSSILAGGNLESVQLSISIDSGGCSLGIGESSTKSLGTMSDGTQGSKSWTMSQGSGGCSFTITATASGGLSRSTSGSVGIPSPGTSGGDGRGGDTDKSTTALKETPTDANVDAQVEGTFSSIPAGKTGTLLIPETTNMPLTEIAIKVKNKVTVVKITVKFLTSKPVEIATASGEVLRYFNIDHTNLEEADLDTVTIKFKVEKTWLTNNNIDPADVVLNRFSTDQWTTLTTTKSSDDTDYVYYSADSPGLSVFVISGTVANATETPPPTEAPAATSAPTETPRLTPMTTEMPTPAPTFAQTPTTEEPLQKTPSPTPTPVSIYKRAWFIGLVLIVLLISMIYVLDRQGRVDVKAQLEKLKKKIPKH